MQSLIKDIQYGVRNLLKRPSYTVIALLTLTIYWRVGNFEFNNFDDPDYVRGLLWMESDEPITSGPQLGLAALFIEV